MAVNITEELVAFHEAGHAVVGIEIGAPVAYAYLCDSVEPNGRVSDGFQPWPPHCSATARAAYHLGGYAAERLLLGQEAFAHSSDYNTAVRWLTGQSPNVDLVSEGALYAAATEVLAESYALARRVVDTQENAVRLIAGELQIRRHVEGTRLREIVESSTV